MTDQPVEPPYAAAAKARKRVPLWAVPIFPALLVWAVIYVNAVQPPPAKANDPLTMGQQIYTQKGCSGCHGASGAGAGAAPGFVGGAVEKTFPDYKQQMAWVNYGGAKWPTDTYGATNKPVLRSGGMPGFGPKSSSSLNCDQIALVVRYEREVLAGGKPEPDLVAATEKIAAAGAADTGNTVTCDIPK